jgi:signal transduction histidine kinase
MELSQIEFKGVKLEKEYIDIKNLLENLKNTNLVRARKKKLKIVIEIDDKTNNIYADEYRIKEVLNNLIINSINYCFPETTILISTYVDSKYQYFSIINEGPSIPEDQIENIFKSFYKININDDLKITKSFGLGLTIVKNIVELHKGKIIAKNIKQNTGVEFLFYIPILEI